MLATGPTMMTTLGLAGGVAVAAPADGVRKPARTTRLAKAAARTSLRNEPSQIRSKLSGGTTLDKCLERVVPGARGAQSRDGPVGYGPIGRSSVRRMTEECGQVGRRSE